MKPPWRKHLPACVGYWRDTQDGPDFDCPADNEGIVCEQCLVNYHTCGGLNDPDTGKNISRFKAWLRYGPRDSEEEPRKRTPGLHKLHGFRWYHTAYKHTVGRYQCWKAGKHRLHQVCHMALCTRCPHEHEL